MVTVQPLCAMRDRIALERLEQQLNQCAASERY